MRSVKWPKALSAIELLDVSLLVRFFLLVSVFVFFSSVGSVVPQPFVRGAWRWLDRPKAETWAGPLELAAGNERPVVFPPVVRNYPTVSGLSWPSPTID